MQRSARGRLLLLLEGTTKGMEREKGVRTGSKREGVDQGEAGRAAGEREGEEHLTGERMMRGIQCAVQTRLTVRSSTAAAAAGPGLDLGNGAVATEHERVEREDVEAELQDLQHLVKTRGYIAQVEK